MHEEWTDQLSDYLDGELPDEERRAVEAHLNGCADCVAVLNELQRVVARAREVATTARPRAAELWAEIAARIETSPRLAAAPRRSVNPVSAPASTTEARPARRLSFTLPQLAAAAALVAAVSGGMVWRLRPAPAPAVAQTPPAASEMPASDDAPSAAAGDRVVLVGMADAQYDAAVADLERAVQQGRGRLDASTIAVVEHNLQIIDQAIDQAREALAADPVNTYLSGHLVEARRRKLDLLRRTAALTSESD